LYRNAFHRDWDKINRFNTDDITNSIRVIMLDPKGTNKTLYNILTGRTNNYDIKHQIILGSNDRWYISQGAQVKATAEFVWLNTMHWVEAGVRLHYDSAELFHTEDPYNMRSGILVRSSGEQVVTFDARDSTVALAGFYHHQVQIGKLQVNLGVREEVINTKHNETLWSSVPPGAKLSKKNRYSVFIPGGGAVYSPLPELQLLAGVHRGFVPSTPTGGQGVDPEDSVNYEAGFRLATPWLSGEAIGFFSDFGNLIGACRSSSGCPPSLMGREYNGGSVHSYGVEAMASTEIPLGGSIIVPARVAYTYQRSTFQEDFISDNPEWGTVEKGYEVPYIPKHQLYVSTGLRGKNWGVEGYLHYTGKMRDIASMEKRLGSPTEATWVSHAAAHYTVGKWGRVHLLVENVLDRPYIVSRRPMGARSGIPRRFVLGYKNTFQ
jgi:Fe(3+) dicitrate transport protein